MKLYYFIESINFDFAASTASISPIYFIENRNFGGKGFFTNKLELNPNFITLYSDIPENIFQEEDTILKKFPIIFEVRIEKEDPYLEKIEEGIYFYSKTIYLSSENFRILFFHKEDLQEIVEKNFMIAQTKFFHLFIEKSHLVKNRKTRNYKLDTVKKEDIEKINPYMNQEIKNDTLLNKMKGFYSMLSCFYLEDEKLKEFSNLYNILTNSEKQIQAFKSKKELNLINKFKKEIEKFHYQSNTIIWLKKENYIVSNAFKKQFLSVKENLVLFEIILNIILKTKKEQGISYEEKLISSIGAEINQYFGQKSVFRKDLAIVYNRIIKANINESIKNVNNEIIKSLFIALLKVDNFTELNLCVEEYSTNKIICYSFWGMLNGFADLKRNYISKVFENPILYKNMLQVFLKYEKEIENKNGSYYTEKRKLYTQLIKLKKIDFIDSIKQKAKEKGIHLTTEKITDKFIIRIRENSSLFNIIFYENKSKLKYKKIYKEFQQTIKKIGLEGYTYNGKYSYFKLYFGDNKNDTISEKKLSDILQNLLERSELYEKF